MCLLGDFIDRRAMFARPVDAGALVARLAPLAAAPRGVFAVLGNHDWYAGARRISDALDAIGRDGAGGLGGAGRRRRPVDRRRRATTGSAARGVDRALMPVPEDAAGAAALARPRRVPVRPGARQPDAGRPHPRRPGPRPAACGARSCPPTTASATCGGHVVEDGRHLYVSSGIGTSGLPVRFLRPPEVVSLTLRAPS